jgi:peptide/nickel transport system substrate-binding protein
MSALITKRMIAIVLVVVILAAAVGGYYYFVQLPAIERAETFIQQRFGDPRYLDPAVCYETYGGMIISHVYETLLWYKGESTAEFEPILAKSWTVSSDGLTYTFKLREGVKFHDGTTFNATAVKYSIDRMILINDPHGPCWMYSYIKGAEKYMASNMTDADVRAYKAAEGVKVIGPYEVQITLDKPFAPFLALMAFSAASIVSPAYVEAHGGVKPGSHNEWMDATTPGKGGMCGTGPFKFVEWIPKQRIVLERNDAYWRTPAKFKKLIYQRVDEPGSRVLALFAGEADLIDLLPGNFFDVVNKTLWLEKGEVKPIKPGVAVYLSPSLAIAHIGFNVKKPPLNDARFREALICSFPYETFIKTVLNNLGFRLNGPIPKGLLGHDPTIPMQEYNLTKAKQLFLEVGWKGKISYYYNTGNVPRMQAGLMLRDSVAKLDVGVEIEVQEFDWPTFLSKLDAGDYEMLMIGWLPDYIDPDDYAVPYCHSTKGTFLMTTGFGDVYPEEAAKIDKLVEEAALVVDPARRAEMYKEIVKKMNDMKMYIWVYQSVRLTVCRDSVKGDWSYSFNPAASGPIIYPLYRG